MDTVSFPADKSGAPAGASISQTMKGRFRVLLQKAIAVFEVYSAIAARLPRWEDRADHVIRTLADPRQTNKGQTTAVQPNTVRAAGGSARTFEANEVKQILTPLTKTQFEELGKSHPEYHEDAKRFVEEVVCRRVAEYQSETDKSMAAAYLDAGGKSSRKGSISLLKFCKDLARDIVVPTRTVGGLETLTLLDPKLVHSIVTDFLRPLLGGDDVKLDLLPHILAILADNAAFNDFMLSREIRTA